MVYLFHHSKVRMFKAGKVFQAEAKYPVERGVRE
jgi:hypothetical protein